MNESILVQIDKTFEDLSRELLGQRFGQRAVVLYLFAYRSTGHVFHEDLQVLVCSCCTVITHNALVIELLVDIDFTFENLHFLDQ